MWGVWDWYGIKCNTIKQFNRAMNKLLGTIPVALLLLFANGCAGGDTKENRDTAAAPATADTMPVVHPQNMDSSSIITTPPVNDSNAIMPDSAIKNK